MFCRKCQRYIRYTDYVVIDNLFNIHHFACGSATFPSAEPVVEEEEPAVESVFYENCSAVRAAGTAPIRKGDPGFGDHLDRDGDGVACE